MQSSKTNLSKPQHLLYQQNIQFQQNLIQINTSSPQQQLRQRGSPQKNQANTITYQIYSSPLQRDINFRNGSLKRYSNKCIFSAPRKVNQQYENQKHERFFENSQNLSILKDKDQYRKQMLPTFQQNNNNNRDGPQNKNDANKNDSSNQSNQQKYKRFIQYDQNRRRNVSQILKNLYDNSSGLRVVEEQYKNYVRDVEDQDALFKNYNLNLKSKQIVRNICNAFIQVRGDGNCFYTAFGFQFLNHLLCSYSDQEFSGFIEDIQKRKITFKINNKKQQIVKEEQEQDLFDEFIYIMEELRQVKMEERFKKLNEEFAKWQINENGNGFLYLLQTIFFRNLSNQFLEASDLKDVVEDKENLLIWEEECNTNEVIIKLLAEQLKIHIQLLFLDDEVVLREYEQNNKNTIILLIKPGHYNIGLKIPKQ